MKCPGLHEDITLVRPHEKTMIWNSGSLNVNEGIKGEKTLIPNSGTLNVNEGIHGK